MNDKCQAHASARAPLSSTVMRLSIVAATLIVAGCASTNPAVVACKKALPKDNYDVVDVVEVKSKAVLEIFASASAPDTPAFVKNYDVHWPKQAHWGPAKTTYLVLLERKPDKLALCQLEIPGCSPTVTWLSGFPQSDPNKLWQVDKRDEGICVLGEGRIASPHNTSLERTRDR